MGERKEEDREMLKMIMVFRTAFTGFLLAVLLLGSWLAWHRVLDSIY